MKNKAVIKLLLIMLNGNDQRKESDWVMSLSQWETSASEIGALEAWRYNCIVVVPPPQRWDLQCWEDRLSQQVLKEKPSLSLPQGDGTSVLYCSLAQAAERGLIKASLWDGRARRYKWRPSPRSLLGCRCHWASVHRHFFLLQAEGVAFYTTLGPRLIKTEAQAH